MKRYWKRGKRTDEKRGDWGRRGTGKEGNVIKVTGKRGIGDDKVLEKRPMRMKKYWKGGDWDEKVLEKR